MSNKRTRARTRDRFIELKPSGLRPFKDAPIDLNGINAIDPRLFSSDIFRNGGLGPQSAGNALSATLNYPLAYVKGRWVIWPVVPTQRLRQDDLAIVVPAGQRRIHRIRYRRGEIESIYFKTTDPSWRFNLYLDGVLVRSIYIIAAFANGLDHATEKYFRILEWNTVTPAYTFLMVPDMKFFNNCTIELINLLGAPNTLTQLDSQFDMRDVKNVDRLAGITAETIV